MDSKFARCEDFVILVFVLNIMYELDYVWTLSYNRCG
jgi:hypothetical protein